jgi:hypothetical protein
MAGQHVRGIYGKQEKRVAKIMLVLSICFLYIINAVGPLGQSKPSGHVPNRLSPCFQVLADLNMERVLFCSMPAEYQAATSLKNIRDSFTERKPNGTESSATLPRATATVNDPTPSHVYPENRTRGIVYTLDSHRNNKMACYSGEIQSEIRSV